MSLFFSKKIKLHSQLNPFGQIYTMIYFMQTIAKTIEQLIIKIS